MGNDGNGGRRPIKAIGRGPAACLVEREAPDRPDVARAIRGGRIQAFTLGGQDTIYEIIDDDGELVRRLVEETRRGHRP